MKWILLLLALASPARADVPEDIQSDGIQVVKYELDHARSTHQINSGTITATIDGPDPLGNFDVNFAFDLYIGRNHKLGEQTITLPGQFFSPAFLPTLRVKGAVALGSLVVTHVGYTDIGPRQGTRRVHADVITIKGFPQDLVKGHLRGLVVTATMSPDVPGLGAALLDLHGRTDGHDVTLAGDYVGPE